MAPLRIGAIGCGDIARRRHFPDLQALGGRAELVAIHGRNAATLAECAAEFGVARRHIDAAAILDDPAIDAVLVLTPPDSHAGFTARAIAAGKHVMVEKPLVRTAAEASALLAALRTAQAAGRPVTCLPLPHVQTPGHALVRRLLEAGAIGEVTSVEAHRGHRGPTHAEWFYDRARAGGGVLLDLGIYQLTAVIDLFGPALAMSASCTRFFAERHLDDGSVVRPDVEDDARLTLTLADGIAVSAAATWNASQPHQQTRARIVAFGREGILYFGGRDGVVHIHRPDGAYGPAFGGPPVAFDGLDCRSLAPEDGPPPSIVGAFVDLVAAGDTGTRNVAVQAHVLDIVEQAYAKAGRGIVLSGGI